MTHFTGHVPPLQGHARSARRAPEVMAAMLGGAVAAGLGFGIIAVLVLFLWITSPFPDSGPDDALRVAAALWLLAHGADLARADALTGGTVPVGLTPLLLAALPCWLLYRAAAHAIARDHDDPAGPEPESDPALGPLATTGWLLAGYLLIGLVLLVFARNGGLRADTVSALLNVPLVAVGAAVLGTWSAGGWHVVRPSPMVRRVMNRVALPAGGVKTACWAAVSGAAALFGGGALLAAGSLAWHGGAAADSFTTLTSSLSGRFAVLLLTLTLVPNAAVWASAYALGPGFALGAGGWVSAAGTVGYPPTLPNFPLLAALPRPTGPQGGTPFAWLVVALPLAAAVLLALRVCRGAVARRWTATRTLVVILLTAAAHGAVVAVVAAFAGGPMGTGTLAAFGPDGLRTGGAAAAWALGAALPVTLIGRWWRLRRSRDRPLSPAPPTPVRLTVPPPSSRPQTHPLTPPTWPDPLKTPQRRTIPERLRAPEGLAAREGLAAPGGTDAGGLREPEGVTERQGRAAQEGMALPEHPQMSGGPKAPEPDRPKTFDRSEAPDRSKVSGESWASGAFRAPGQSQASEGVKTSEGLKTPPPPNPWRAPGAAGPGAGEPADRKPEPNPERKPEPEPGSGPE
ncbi:cell division protein PerM [Streptantibioticus silvisoli]|uniref:DUF6350 family protein n=1 Tax=Streptantibioticus silvisoli TaxID=2705255 RepID=A0ABT6W546_9ACTN|nr:DUF6350 family protein [Streptantibioticus silvisoli]MDI5965851.1 DUF6350 family protein [Streptantibioticus silvisoli]